MAGLGSALLGRGRNRLFGEGPKNASFSDELHTIGGHPFDQAGEGNQQAVLNLYA